jgi:hypothetical protein
MLDFLLSERELLVHYHVRHFVPTLVSKMDYSLEFELLGK